MNELARLITDVKEHVLYLQELGVGDLSVELPYAASPKSEVQSPKYKVSFVPVLAQTIPAKSSQNQTPGSRLASLPSLSNRPVTPRRADSEGSFDQTIQNPEVPSAQTVTDETLFGDMKPKLEETADTIESIRAEIGDCTRCLLYSQGRTKIVHSTGNFNADLMFVGEAPGADEDEQGFPFVGRAGQLLTKIIESIGLTREEVFIGNINRCRPPGNRQPVPEETAACRPFLLREVAVVRPKVIVVLGNTATQNLLNVKTPISKLRGNFQDYFGVKVMPTFHPAYLLRDPHKKREVWEDMKKVRDYLNE